MSSSLWVACPCLVGSSQVGVLPWMAMTYALHFTGTRFRENYTRFLQGDESVSLAALHAESSGLKALLTQVQTLLFVAIFTW